MASIIRGLLALCVVVALGEVGKYAGILTHCGLYPETGIVATADEIRALVEEK